MDTDIKTVKLSQQKDPAFVAALLRLWVVELPEPLLTFRLYDSFIGSAPASRGIIIVSERVWLWVLLINSLEDTHACT